MITTIPDLEAYPKTILLRDRTEVVIRPLDQGDTGRLFKRVGQAELQEVEAAAKAAIEAEDLDMSD